MSSGDKKEVKQESRGHENQSEGNGGAESVEDKDRQEAATPAAGKASSKRKANEDQLDQRTKKVLVTKGGVRVAVRLPKTGHRHHCCLKCDRPILVYGRLRPCNHAFCLVCASEMEKCIVCEAEILFLERIEKPKNGQRLFISPLTLQSCKTLEDLQVHTEKVCKRLEKKMQMAMIAPK